MAARKILKIRKPKNPEDEKKALRSLYSLAGNLLKNFFNENGVIDRFYNLLDKKAKSVVRGANEPSITKPDCTAFFKFFVESTMANVIEIYKQTGSVVILNPEVFVKTISDDDLLKYAAYSIEVTKACASKLATMGGKEDLAKTIKQRCEEQEDYFQRISGFAEVYNEGRKSYTKDLVDIEKEFGGDGK